jgi:hypothetical protein
MEAIREKDPSAAVREHFQHYIMDCFQLWIEQGYDYVIMLFG